MIGDAYSTRNQLKAQLHLSSSNSEEDAWLDAILTAASRTIEDHCHRQFNNDGDVVATARIYKPSGRRLVIVDDFYDSTTAVVKSAPVGQSFGTAWATTSYEFEPLNGVVGGVGGKPFNRIVLPYQALSPDYDRVQLTAKWGWASVPAAVKQACLVLAEFLHVAADAPTGMREFRAGGEGIATEHIRKAPSVEFLLQPYIVNSVLIG